MNIISWCLFGGLPSSLFVSCSWRLPLSCRIIPITSSASMPGHSLLGISSCQSFLRAPSRTSCAWPTIVLYLLRAVLINLLSGILACWYRFCQAFVKLWKWAFWWSSTIPLSAYPLGAWPIVVVVTSIGCVVRRPIFLQFHYEWTVWCFSDQCVFERSSKAGGKRISDCIVPASPVLLVPRCLTLLPNILVQVHRWLPEYHSSELLGSEGPRRSLRLAFSTRMRLTLEAGATGIFPTWLVVWSWVTMIAYALILTFFERYARLLTTLPPCLV